MGDIRDLFAGAAAAEEAVFRAEESDELDARIPQAGRGMAARGGQAGRMSHEAHPLAREPFGRNGLDAGTDGGRSVHEGHPSRPRPQAGDF